VDRLATTSRRTAKCSSSTPRTPRIMDQQWTPEQFGRHPSTATLKGPPGECRCPSDAAVVTSIRGRRRRELPPETVGRRPGDSAIEPPDLAPSEMGGAPDWFLPAAVARQAVGAEVHRLGGADADIGGGRGA